MRARPLSNWPNFTVRASHPNLLYVLLIHELRVVVFYRCSHFHCILETNCLAQKNVRATVKWLQIVALKKSPTENVIVFLRLLSCQTIGFLEFLSPKFNSNYYYGRENQNNSARQSNQALIENFVEDIDFMLSVHY